MSRIIMMDTLEYVDVVVHPIENGWRTVKRITYKDIIIREGYYTNGANIPRLLWRLIPPNDPSVFPAVVVHDFICDMEEYIKADDYMEEILIASNIPKWKRKSIVIGIRFYTRWIRR